VDGYAQTTRFLELETPLGPDALLLTDFRGSEAFSQLFSYELVVLSQRPSLAFDDLVGKKATVMLRHGAEQSPRYFNGIVSRIAAGGPAERGQREYRLELVPWLWLLSRTADCRIFQNKTALEILTEIFDELGLREYDLGGVRRQPLKREYCVQYRESDLGFVSRLLEEEGIFYAFRHERGKHTLVIGDDPGFYKDGAEPKIDYLTGSAIPNVITQWARAWAFRPGAWAQTDYNFETPSTKLLATKKTIVKLSGAERYEWFEYPGVHLKKPDGEALAKLRIEAEEAAFETVDGASTCRSLAPGGKFSLRRSACGAEAGTSWALTRVAHHAWSQTYHAGEGGAEGYENSFTCIPATVVFRPPRLTRKPLVYGVQTATVTGPAGEEIYTDEYGRIKVQFHWDRLGKNDEKSSCWVRVAHPVAGKQWGFVSLPRIGQEVVVEFIDGDPDRPLVLGSVYNAEQMPPYALPSNKTQTGFKSRSSLGGGPANCNELRFEDKKGYEQLYIHAEKNQDIEVENDETHWVGHDRAKTVDHDETTQVKHDRTETVGNNETITIGVDRTENVGSNETITIGGSRTEAVALNEAIAIGISREEVVGAMEVVAIGVNRTHTIGRDESLSVGNDRTVEVGGDETASIGKNRTHTVGDNDTLSVAKKLSVTAGDEISIVCGDASILMKKDGTISISGKNITIKASKEIHAKADGNVTIKGQKVLQN
jgi:type VI secretion system secreted protein VgrG